MACVLLPVLSVVAFHAFPSLVKGGFVGVDIFFVISGYLISSIIFGGLAKGSFSFRAFYARRMRRIFPGLILVMCACYIIGWFVLLGDEYKQLGKHIAGGAGFVGNFVLWKEAGYFDVRSALKPLLHLWSLGIEEQFYIVWPLTLYLAAKWRLNCLVLLLSVLGASFFLNIGTVHRHSVTAFYSPATRLWELQLGSLLAYLTLFTQRLQNWASARDVRSWLGMFLILAAAFGLRKGVQFPGWWALLPTIGAFLVISAGPEAWLNRNVLSHRMIVWVGLISYPLYLWHWPVLSFARITIATEPKIALSSALVTISFLLAWMTYRLIERPVRFGKAGATKVAVLCSAMLIVGCLGLNAFKQNGFLSREIVSRNAKIDEARFDWVNIEDFKGDNFRTVNFIGETPEKVVFLGDSRMEQYYPRVQLLYENGKPRLSAVFASAAGCPPFSDTHIIADGGIDCDKAWEEAVRIASRPDVRKVVISASWEYYVAKDPPNLKDRFDRVLENFGKFISQLISDKKDVYVILSSPSGVELNPLRIIGSRWTQICRSRGTNLNQSVATSKLKSDKDKWTGMQNFMEVIARTAKINGARVIDPFEYFCDSTSCPSVINGRPLYIDFGHLRASFARERATFMDGIVEIQSDTIGKTSGLTNRSALGGIGHQFNKKEE